MRAARASPDRLPSLLGIAHNNRTAVEALVFARGSAGSTGVGGGDASGNESAAGRAHILAHCARGAGPDQNELALRAADLDA